MFLFAILLLGITNASAQQNNEDLKIKPLLGVWQYVEEMATPDGETTFIGKQIYKTITWDKKYYVIVGLNSHLKPLGKEILHPKMPLNSGFGIDLKKLNKEETNWLGELD